jgi:3',5'-cyclic-AMP phosphodiesterase
VSGRPTVLVQLSDPHIGATWAEGDPVAGLATAVGSIRRLRPAPDALLLTGDLADTRADSEYAHVLGTLKDIDAACYPLPGNHDDRDGLRRHFGIPGEPGTPVQYAVELSALRILAGHVHRAIAGELAGRRVLSAPSTYIGFALDFVAPQIDDIPTPPGYVVHVWRDGELASHVVAVPTG